MQPHTDTTTLTTSGAQGAVSFGLSGDDTAHLMGILRNGLYTDRVAAVLREYAANAWDAHRVAGATRPIEIHLPEPGDLELRVRDHGPGLSHDDVFKVYTQYGRSTKRGDNVTVGALGIGSKSAFCYADTFTVISRHGGMRRTYVAALDARDIGTMLLVDERPDDGTGVEVRLLAKPGDVGAFRERARRLFAHVTPRPAINVDLPALADAEVLAEGAITPHRGEWVALMGCIPYRIDLAQVEGLVPACLADLSGVVPFAIGEVTMAASREELRYTDATKAAVSAKLCALVDAYVTRALAELDRPDVSAWARRLRVRVLDAMGLPLPQAWADYALQWVKLDVPIGVLTVINAAGNVTTRAVVEPGLVLYLDDTPKALPLKGYGLSALALVVRPAPGVALATAEAALAAMVAAAELIGVAVRRLSAATWQRPAGMRAPSVYNPAHRAKMFELLPARIHADKRSDAWTMITRPPTAADVYVTLEAFRPYDGFATDYRADAAALVALGGAMPTVYGYKASVKGALAPVGTEYRTWRRQEFAARLTPALRAQVEALRACERLTVPHRAADVAYLREALGDAHPLVQAYGFQARGEWPAGLKHAWSAARLPELGVDARVTAAAAVLARYPLLAAHGVEELWAREYVSPHGWQGDKARRAAWLDYVRLIDARDLALALADVAA